MSKIILKREIELEDLIPKSNVKDYSKLDPSWPACVLCAAADAMNTVGIFEVLNKEYTEAKHHSQFIYTLEKKVLVATRWMMRTESTLTGKEHSASVKKLRSCGSILYLRFTREQMIS